MEKQKPIYIKHPHYHIFQYDRKTVFYNHNGLIRKFYNKSPQGKINVYIQIKYDEQDNPILYNKRMKSFVVLNDIYDSYTKIKFQWNEQNNITTYENNKGTYWNTNLFSTYPPNSITQEISKSIHYVTNIHSMTLHQIETKYKDANIVDVLDFLYESFLDYLSRIEHSEIGLYTP